MKQFTSIEKIDTAILYALELTSSISVLLLAFGLIASMANVLTKGSVLTDNLTMQRVWAWTQCIAIDASVAGTILRTFQYHAQGEWVKTWLHGLLSVLPHGPLGSWRSPQCEDVAPWTALGVAALYRCHCQHY